MTNVAPDLATHSSQGDHAVEASTSSNRTRRVIFYASIAWLVLIVVFVVLGELNPLVGDIDERNRELINAGPSWSNWFGNDNFGRDVFSRVIVGGRLSLLIAGSVTLIGIVVGGALGLLAGYYRAWFDSAVRLVINVTLSVPALLLVIFIVTVNGRSLTWVIVALSLLAIPALARIVRASTLQVADREYVKAAEVLGVTRSKILVREVAPNVMPTMVSFAFLTTGIIVVAEGALAFLGLSVLPPDFTWGSIITAGRDNFQEAPHVVFTPALVLFLTVLSLNFVGDQLLRRFDIKEAGL
jgi:peptide/nickel transport system permease protein